ncbi:hypothetical protein SKP52_07820 [Sphingopyxis fribergensis]|uniref:Uncharacterized protein n=1 Tax=Sphingopyxis fribergensis TaxID=1515612 RepID=A0A0A7PGV5_9SPHN|nr:hypothetical protein [Sphingopyxis fribergensis]AJA08483.1 hypothetical protein SKP52_07820 [Sphingopyxis fribergensis]
MTTDINTIAAELEAAKADLAQWERLTSAADRLKALTVSFDQARIAQAKADEAAAKEAAEARFKGLTNIRVTSSGGGGVLSQQFLIRWTAPVYDMYSMAAVPQPHERPGFETIPDNVLAFLIERHPEEIPAAIMALAPGDPAAAMSEYFRARQRGYVKGTAAE